MTSPMYNYDTVKKYNAKCKQFGIKYTLKELEIAETLEKAVANSSLTMNAWIKEAVKEKLEREGYLIRE